MEKTLNYTIGERIKELRLEKGFSQNDLAKHSKLSQSAIARWESGERAPTIDSLVVLARYFGVSTDYLLGLED